MDLSKVLIAVLLGFRVTKSTSFSTSVSKNGNFTISATTSDWKSSCKGRKPAEVNVHWDTLSLDGDISVPENISRVWIGYYRQYQYFSVKGCASAGSGGTRIGKVDNPLGHCFTLCNHRGHIGLAGAMCHCLSDEIFDALQISNATCSYETCGSGLVCGSNSNMWIYGAAKPHFTWNSIADNNFMKKCVSLTKNNGATWNVVECSQNYRALCMENDGTFDKNEAAVVRGKTWDAALKICHDKLETLANISLENFRTAILNQHISDFQTGWTSFVRDMVLGSNEVPTDMVDCAVIFKSDGNVKLEYQNCGNFLPAVCLNELPSTGTVTTTTFTTPVAATLTPPAPTKHDSTASAANAFNQLPRTSSTIVSNTSNMQTETSTSHSVATGRRPTETSATSSMETLTTTASTTRKATSTSSKTESISSTITIPPSTSTITATTTYTTPKTTTRRTEASMTNGSTTPTTSIPNKTPKANTTKIFNTSNTQPTSTNLPGAKDSTLTETSATSSTRPITTTASITQGATNSSSTAGFPMAGRIGLGILAILVVAGVVLAIKKMTAKKKRPPSIQTTADSSDHKTELSKGIPMLDVNDINDVNDVKHSNGRVGNSSLQTDTAYSTNCQYAKVVKVGKSSPKIIETTPEPDTNTYDTTYVHQEKIRDTGDDYQHIYDHTNSKNLE